MNNKYRKRKNIDNYGVCDDVCATKPSTVHLYNDKHLPVDGAFVHDLHSMKDTYLSVKSISLENPTGVLSEDDLKTLTSSKFNYIIYDNRIFELVEDRNNEYKYLNSYTKEDSSEIVFDEITVDKYTREYKLSNLKFSTEALNAELAKKLEAEDLADYAKTADVNAELGKKVDKVEDKSLVSDALIAKMEGIQDNAIIKTVGAGLALSETNELSVDADTLPAIAIAKVSGLQDALDTKQTAEQVSATIAAAKIKSTQIEGTVASAATADKVANALTAGGKTFNGSEAVEITAVDLGALTAIPQATEDALGGIKIGHASAANEAALKLDEEGKAYVDVPAAVVYSAKENGGLEMDANHAFSIKEVSTDLLKQGAKTLVLDGGTAVEQ